MTRGYFCICDTLPSIPDLHGPLLFNFSYTINNDVLFLVSIGPGSLLTLCTRSAIILAHAMYSRSAERQYIGAEAPRILLFIS